MLDQETWNAYGFHPHLFSQWESRKWRATSAFRSNAVWIIVGNKGDVVLGVFPSRTKALTSLGRLAEEQNDEITAFKIGEKQ